MNLSTLEIKKRSIILLSILFIPFLSANQLMAQTYVDNLMEYTLTGPELVTGKRFNITSPTAGGNFVGDIISINGLINSTSSSGSAYSLAGLAYNVKKVGTVGASNILYGGTFIVDMEDIIVAQTSNSSSQIAGARGMIMGTISSSSNSGTVYAGLIGEDRILGENTFASYFIGKSYFSGNVGIGTTNPTEELTVKGTILASKVEIKNDSEIPASDYVFGSDYNLRSLLEVEQFVKTNKHLPEVPSAEEFKENGYSVGEMDDILLRKVEELTLYVIEQQKQIEELKVEIAKLNN